MVLHSCPALDLLNFNFPNSILRFSMRILATKRHQNFFHNIPSTSSFGPSIHTIRPTRRCNKCSSPELSVSDPSVKATSGPWLRKITLTYSSHCNGSWVTYSRRGETFYNLKFQEKSEKSVTSRLWILHYLVVNFPPIFIPWRRTMVWIISRESHLSPLSGCHFDWKKTLDFLQSRYPGLAAVPWSPRFKGRRSRKKIPCSALMAFFEFSHSGSEENLTKHPIRKAWQSYNAFGLCEYLGALKCKMLRFNEISWVHLAFLHVFSFPFLGAFTGQRLMSLRSNLAAWLKPPHGPLLSAPHLDEITMKWFSWNEMTISLNLRSNLHSKTQSKALRVNISAKVKGSAGAVSTGLVWPWTKTLQKVNRINTYQHL